MQNKPNPISAKRVVITSFLVDVSDVVLNLIVSILTGSIILRAEFLQGAADMIGSGLLIVGIKQAKKKADRAHPFGFGKELYFWTLLSALMMVAVASSFSFYFGLTRVLNPQPIDNLPLALLVLLVATMTNGYSFSLSVRRLMGKRSFSRFWEVFWQTPLVETKNALVQDLMGTSSALAGLLSLLLYQTTGIAAFDGIGAMGIGVILAILASFLIHGLRDYVVGRSAPATIEEKITKEVLSVPKVKAVLDLRTMMVGSEKILVNIEVHLENHLTTDQIEKLIDKIKQEVRQAIPSIEHIQVELESPEG